MKDELMELKARVESLDVIRKKLRGLEAHFVGIFHQVDVFFNVSRGRLKLRRVEEEEEAKLIYYERENILGPKKSNVIILSIHEPELAMMLFENILGKKIVIDKKREIYIYKGTQIHLDIVKNLGKFIEFERKIKDFTKDQKILEDLAIKLGIKDKDRLKGSYSDIALESERESTI